MTLPNIEEIWPQQGAYLGHDLPREENNTAEGMPEDSTRLLVERRWKELCD